jgi:hypothetical protein
VRVSLEGLTDSIRVGTVLFSRENNYRVESQVDKGYAAEIEQNIRDMQLSRQTARQTQAVKEIQEAITHDPEIGTWLH